ncbi:hypothetical protein ACF3DV_23180 [Chlorogloeopsis fritschii PCC 9212]|nr:hypothetical protein [Chlorogloeopsis fritschii]
MSSPQPTPPPRKFKLIIGSVILFLGLSGLGSIAYINAADMFFTMI